MEAEELPFDTVRGSSGCRGFGPGHKFTLSRHEIPSEEGKSYLLTSVQHSASDDTYASGPQLGRHYENGFVCVPSDIVFRPARITPKPVIQGPQTAVVVGPGGEEIYTDKSGRV
jgi:type VI secretion system secreted protein VgrG